MPMEQEHLLTLAKTYGAHINRGLFTVAGRVGVHSRFFTRLEAQHGCHIATYARVLAWFSENWPSDLEWPVGIPRPAKSKREAA